MKRPFSLLVCGLLFLASLGLPLRAAEIVWPHQQSDLKPDPAVTWGQLANGLRYAIMHNEQPGESGGISPRVSLRLHVHAGSLMEEDDQQGLAHFLEHMAFNGTRHYAPGEMQVYFQRLGMQFGPDTNAHTSFNETVYQLELPENSDAYLNDALTLLRDYADGMLLADEEILKERGVILNELLYRDSTDFRTAVEGLKFMFPEARFVERFPVGKAEIIGQASRDRFIAFYEKWYTPDRMAVVIVGPVSAPETIAQLETAFGSMPPAANRAADPDPGQVTMGRGLQIKLNTEKHAGATQIQFAVARPARRVPDTFQSQMEEAPLVLANIMLNRRLSKLTAGEQPPFLAASASAADQFELGFADVESLSIVCNPDSWQRALASGEQELRRALSYGFADAELDQVKAAIHSILQDGASSAGTRDSRTLADNLVEHVAQGKVLMHPSSELELGTAILEAVTVDQCVEALRTAWGTDDVWIYVSGNLSLDDGPNQIREVLLASTEAPVTPPAEAAAAEWAYTDFGTPGQVTAMEEVPDLGLTLVTFGNQTRLNLKPTNFEQDTIQINVNFGAGRLTAPHDQPGLIAFAADNFIGGGLERHGIREIVDLLADKKAGAQFHVRNETFSLSGATNRQDLKFQMQLLCAFLTSPGFRSENLASYQQYLDASYAQMEHDANGVLQLNLAKLLYPGDVRFGVPDKSDLRLRTMAELQAWLAEAMASSFLEISVVGDFDAEAVIDAVANTFGALPARLATKPDHPAQRLVARATPAGEEVLQFESDIAKSTVVVQWPTTDCRNSLALKRQFDILASILGDRVTEKVREELGSTYSPYVGNEMSATFAGNGALTAELTCDAQDAHDVVNVVRQLGAQLAADGVTADELERAKAPQLKQVEEARRQNGFWLAGIETAQSDPRSLDDIRSMATDYTNVTREDMHRLAQIYLTGDRAIVMVSLPVTAQTELAAADNPRTLLRPVSDVKRLPEEAVPASADAESIPKATAEAELPLNETRQANAADPRNAEPRFPVASPAAGQSTGIEPSSATTTPAVDIAERPVATAPNSAPRQSSEPVTRQPAGRAPRSGETDNAQSGRLDNPAAANASTSTSASRKLTGPQRAANRTAIDPARVKVTPTRAATVGPSPKPALLHHFISAQPGHRQSLRREIRRELMLYTDWSFRLSLVAPSTVRNAPLAQSTAPRAIEGKWAVRDGRLVLTFRDGFVDSGQITSLEPAIELVFAGDRWRDVAAAK